MPSKKRPPLDYTPQYAQGMFRPREVVEGELANMAPEEDVDGPSPSDELNGRSDERTEERPNVRTNERTEERTNERTTNQTDAPVGTPAVERRRIRHSFDIWQDQLLALVEIQTGIFKRTGQKPKLGELVQEALETYIAAKLPKPTKTARSAERSIERTNERQRPRG